jgi:uncharacterized membrane protein
MKWGQVTWGPLPHFSFFVAVTMRPLLTFRAALGSGLIGGVFFGFSTFVMRALTRLPAPAACGAMQSINRAVITPLFLIPFLGTAACCGVLTALSLRHLGQPASAYRLAACALYLLGTFATTMLGNVPLNNTLEKFDPDSADAAVYWPTYACRWTRWNHLRTAAAVAALAGFIWTIGR